MNILYYRYSNKDFDNFNFKRNNNYYLNNVNNDLSNNDFICNE